MERIPPLGIRITNEIIREEQALQRSMMEEVYRASRMIAAFEQASSMVPVEPPALTIDILRQVRDQLRLDCAQWPSIVPKAPLLPQIRTARKVVRDPLFGRQVLKVEAASGQGRCSAYVFSATTGDKLGLSMFTVKDCDETVNWDSDAMAKRPRFA